MFAGTGQEAGSWLRFYYFRKRVNDFTIFGKTRKRFYGLRRVEFIFSQSAPAVCLPCRQTDDVCRLYHDFSGTCRGLSLKKCVKLALTAFWRTESEVLHLTSFSCLRFFCRAAQALFTERTQNYATFSQIGSILFSGIKKSFQ